MNLKFESNVNHCIENTLEQSLLHQSIFVVEEYHVKKYW